MYIEREVGMSKKNILKMMLFVLFLFGFWEMSRAARLEVTTTKDNVPGSLRAAITAANSNNEDDTIFLQADTYTLTIPGSKEDQNASGDIDIHSNITIVGVGASDTIIQAGTEFSWESHLKHDCVDRIFHIHPGVIVVMRGITLRYGIAPDGEDVDEGYAGNGESGGGILCQSAHLTMEFCIIDHNRAGWGGFPNKMGGPMVAIPGVGGNGGGICCENGMVILNQCTIMNNSSGSGGVFDGQVIYWAAAGNGGGIYNTGNLFLNNCTIHTCWAGYGDAGGNGGGICNLGIMDAINCTFSENMAGPGFLAGGNGGGIYNGEDSSSTIQSCTIYKNQAGDCDHYGHGGSGGGIFNHSLGKVYPRNSIIAGNEAEKLQPGETEYEPKGYDCDGTFVSRDFNLVKDTNRCTFTGETIHNITGLDAQLEALADNGGPTQTHALQPGSPAVDAGSSGEYKVDQRGYLRPVIIGDDIADDGADIGAFESGSASAIGSINTDKDQLYFGALEGGIASPSQIVLISGTGQSELNWFISLDNDWIIVTPLSGQGNNSLSVSVNNDGLKVGTYSGTIKIISEFADNSPQNIPVFLNIYGEGQTINPFGEMDTPIDGAVVYGSIPVTGWVLDDIGIQNVQVFRVAGTNPVYIGDAVFVEGARPDVEQSYPDYPNNSKAGWGYMMLTNFLPNAGNGTFKIQAVAVDLEGNQVILGTKVIICENSQATKPFGAIDTPGQGGFASGSNYVNWGWALTPQPNTIPTDGSGIIVWVDSMPVGNPVYNLYRKDIAALFPGYNNSQGAVGYFYLDTTQYKNGVHTIAWSVTDDAGNTDGIGSRYFSILNINSSSKNTGKTQSNTTLFKEFNSAVPEINEVLSKIQPLPYRDVEVVRGFRNNSLLKTQYTDDKGILCLEIKELEHLEIRMNPNLSPLSSPVFDRFHGYMIAGNRVKTLPVGSTLDRERGIFYWQPGPGFLGNYRFTFFEKSDSGDEYKNRTDVVVVIVPKFKKEG
jgi:hypothetical protein